MFLLFLHEEPLKCADLVPNKLKFKQLLEVCQLVCSTGISKVYKPIKQGKELQEWIKKYPEWTAIFFWKLKNYCKDNVKLKYKTFLDIEMIYNDLYFLCANRVKKIKEPLKTAIFRYSKDYEQHTTYKTNSELPIEVCVKEYEKYINWKKEKGVKGYV